MKEGNGKYRFYSKDKYKTFQSWFLSENTQLFCIYVSTTDIFFWETMLPHLSYVSEISAVSEYKVQMLRFDWLLPYVLDK